MVRRPAMWIMAALLSSAALAAPAVAHAVYESSSPLDDATVSGPPSEVWVEFTELLSEGSYLHVFDPCGRRVDHDDQRISGRRVTVTMAAEASGTYGAEWYAISAQDPHATRGRFVFTSTAGESCDRSSGDDSNGTGGGGGPGAGDAGSGPRDVSAAALRPIAQGRDRREPPLVPKDIPLDGVLVSLALAVLIGAAGGRIYAGIMGYRR